MMKEKVYQKSLLERGCEFNEQFVEEELLANREKSIRIKLKSLVTYYVKTKQKDIAELDLDQLFDVCPVNAVTRMLFNST